MATRLGVSVETLYTLTLNELYAIAKGVKLKALDQTEHELENALFIRYAIFSKEFDINKVFNKQQLENDILNNTDSNNNKPPINVEALKTLRHKLSFNN